MPHRVGDDRKVSELRVRVSRIGRLSHSDHRPSPPSLNVLNFGQEVVSTIVMKHGGISPVIQESQFSLCCPVPASLTDSFSEGGGFS